MTQSPDSALLPTGLSDLLPPHADAEANARESLIRTFVRNGYDRIKPPLVEFEDHLLTGTGAAMAAQTFRLMDPNSQRMMGVRADITPQIARIASTRLEHWPRPLRLCYSGEVLRVRGTQLRPERQFTQAGAELIGVEGADADAESILMSCEALRHLGISSINVDICQPMLVPDICEQLAVSSKVADDLRAALDRKDGGEVQRLASMIGPEAEELLVSLIELSGPSEKVIDRIAALPLTGKAAESRDSLIQVAQTVIQLAPELEVTLDPAENRGFEYHTGVTFTLFTPGVRGELGSGGRYIAGSAHGDGGEPSTGFTLFLDSILRGLKPPPKEKTVLVPRDATLEKVASLQSQGFRTLRNMGAALSEDTAYDLKCTHILKDDQAFELPER